MLLYRIGKENEVANLVDPICLLIRAEMVDESLLEWLQQ